MSILLKQEVSLKYNEDKSKRCPPDFAILSHFDISCLFYMVKMLTPSCQNKHYVMVSCTVTPCRLLGVDVVYCGR